MDLKRLFRARSVYGIDISSTYVKLLVLSREATDRYRVESFAKTKIASGAVIEKEIKDSDALTQAINKAVSLSQVKAKYAVVALADSSVITKVITMDGNLNDLEMQEQILVEAGKHIPYPIEDVYLDFQIIGRAQKNPNGVDVVLTATRAETLAMYVSAITNADLTVKIVDVESFVLQKAYHLLADHAPSQDFAKSVAIFTIGECHTLLTIISQMKPSFTRTEKFADHTLIKTINKHYQEDYDEQALTLVKEKVWQHLSRGLQYYTSTKQYDEIQHLILAGRAANFPGLSAYLEKRLGFRVSIADPIKNMAMSKKVDKALLSKNSSSLMICCGLALRGLDL